MLIQTNKHTLIQKHRLSLQLILMCTNETVPNLPVFLGDHPKIRMNSELGMFSFIVDGFHLPL